MAILQTDPISMCRSPVQTNPQLDPTPIPLVRLEIAIEHAHLNALSACDSAEAESVRKTSRRGCRLPALFLPGEVRDEIRLPRITCEKTPSFGNQGFRGRLLLEWKGKDIRRRGSVYHVQNENRPNNTDETGSPKEPQLGFR